MKLTALTSLAAAGALLVAAFSPQQLLDKQASILKDAKTLKVTYTVRRLPGEAVEYKLTYAKPGLVLVESPSSILESDGKTLWEYNKTAKTYTETPATPELIAKRAQSDEVLAWASFFASDFLKNATDVKAGASRSIKGVPVTEVGYTLPGSTPRIVTLYIDDKLGIARGMSLKGSGADLLAMASSIEVGNDAGDPAAFAFKAPEGATKAVAPVASATGWSSVQPVFASNCGRCHGGTPGKAGFSVATYQSVMKGSDDGPVITPGDPDNSLVVKLITGKSAPHMPPQGQVSQEDIDKIVAWIKAGAKE